MSMLNICLPVHSSAGLSTAGVGRSTWTLASLISQTSWLTSARDRSRSLLVNKKDAVRKSCVYKTTLGKTRVRQQPHYTRTNFHNSFIFMCIGDSQGFTGIHRDFHQFLPTCVAATRISPFLGVRRLWMTPMSAAASAFASSVWGTCRFISSPSKSAL